MTNLQRCGVILLAIYGAYSAHDIWLLDRTTSACEAASKEATNRHELLGAQRVCSAAGVDTSDMLKTIFPPSPRAVAGLAR